MRIHQLPPVGEVQALKLGLILVFLNSTLVSLKLSSPLMQQSGAQPAYPQTVTITDELRDPTTLALTPSATEVVSFATNPTKSTTIWKINRSDHLAARDRNYLDQINA